MFPLSKPRHRDKIGNADASMRLISTLYLRNKGAIHHQWTALVFSRPVLIGVIASPDPR